MLAKLKTLKNKENVLMDITIAFKVQSNLEMVEMIDDNHIKTKFHEQTRLFKLDFVFDEKDKHLSQLLSRLVILSGVSNSSVSFFVSDHSQRLMSDEIVLKEVLSELTFASHEVYMSYYYVDWQTNITNDLFDLFDNVQGMEYSMLARRRIHSVQHAFDLIQLGNLKHKHKNTNNKKDLIFVLKFEVLYDRKSVSHFLIDLALGDEELSKNSKLIMLDNFVCTRQRNKQMIDSNVLFDQISPCLNVAGSRLILISQLSEDRLKSNQTLSYLEMLERIKQYGTAEDVFGDIILLKNKALLEMMHSISNEDDKLKLTITLLNNVSLLEAQMLEADKSFLEKMSNKLEVHKNIYKSFVDVNSESNMSIELVERWLKMFEDAATENKVMEEHVLNYKLGLEQLKNIAHCKD